MLSTIVLFLDHAWYMQIIGGIGMGYALVRLYKAAYRSNVTVVEHKQR